MRKYIIKTSIPALIMLMTACHSSDEFSEHVQETKVLIGATIAGNNKTSKADEYYKHDNFIKNRSRIRVVNTVNYSTPDFSDDGDYREYIYTDTDDTGANFFPYKKGATDPGDLIDESFGFDWDKIVPTSSAFVFEAACYPMKYEPFTKIATDQSNQENFWSADLLLAHTRKPLSERYNLLRLKFWHVFSMVRVEIELPIADEDTDSGFPDNTYNGEEITETTIKEIRLNNMQVEYEIDYAASIGSDGLRTVKGKGNKDGVIKMYRLPGTDKTEDGKLYCSFAAIVPTQIIEKDKPLVELTIRTIVGVDSDKKQIIEDKEYIFKPNTAIEMTQAHITVLKLSNNEDTSNPVLISAQIIPWDNAYTEIDLTPTKTLINN